MRVLLLRALATSARSAAKTWLDNNAGVTHVGMKYGKQGAK